MRLLVSFFLMFNSLFLYGLSLAKTTERHTNPQKNFTLSLCVTLFFFRFCNWSAITFFTMLFCAPERSIAEIDFFFRSSFNNLCAYHKIRRECIVSWRIILSRFFLLSVSLCLCSVWWGWWLLWHTKSIEKKNQNSLFENLFFRSKLKLWKISFIKMESLSGWSSFRLTLNDLEYPFHFTFVSFRSFITVRKTTVVQSRFLMCEMKEYVWKKRKRNIGIINPWRSMMDEWKCSFESETNFYFSFYTN